MGSPRKTILWECLRRLALLPDRRGLGPECGGVAAAAELVEENGVVSRNSACCG